ncbi:hypothetical protein [Nocardia noduli]|uniref:hypothetical protein n=1 Tax=Nocardia noduli TaxID=2815722 RepID=UPI001C2162E8|nr:hypothetical protein [Nocardia noduli]
MTARTGFDGIDPEDRLPARYRLTGPRAVALTLPTDTDTDTVALRYLREHLPEGQRLIRHDRTPAADAVASWVTTSWDTVLTAVIADTTTGEVTAHQLLYRIAPTSGGGDRVRVELAHRHEFEGSDYYRGLDPRLLTGLTPVPAAVHVSGAPWSSSPPEHRPPTPPGRTPRPDDRCLAVVPPHRRARPRRARHGRHQPLAAALRRIRRGLAVADLGQG